MVPLITETFMTTPDSIGCRAFYFSCLAQLIAQLTANDHISIQRGVMS
jgi:hypothetical protein